MRKVQKEMRHNTMTQGETKEDANKQTIHDEKISFVYIPSSTPFAVYHVNPNHRLNGKSPYEIFLMPTIVSRKRNSNHTFYFRIGFDLKACEVRIYRGRSGEIG